MSVADESSEVLRILEAIPQERIDFDIANCGIKQKDNSPEPSQDGIRSSEPNDIADDHHNHLIKAKVLFELSSGEDAAFLLAVMAAEGVGEAACAVAHSKDRIAELGKQMREIEKREGLEDGEYWALGEGPEDYEKLVAEIDALYDGVRDTMFVHTLRRYRLDSIADLFETNRPKFDELRERVRKAVFEDGKKKRGKTKR